MSDKRAVFLTLDGVFGGSTQAAIDGSSNSKEFIFKPENHAMGEYDLYGMSIEIEDDGLLRAERYGAIVPLENGTTVEIRKGGVSERMEGSQSVCCNAQWSRLAQAVWETTFGSGDNFLAWTWRFDNFGGPVRLNPADELVVTINDDLTDIIKHSFVALGKEHSGPVT